MKIKLLLLSLTAIFMGVIARANAFPPGTGEPTKKNDILGGVAHVETKKPLTNVSVTAYLLSKKEKVAVTDINGNYAFNDLKQGTYKFVFEKDGYRKVTKDKVAIKTDDGFQLNIEMEEERDFNFIPGAFSF